MAALLAPVVACGVVGVVSLIMYMVIEQPLWGTLAVMAAIAWAVRRLRRRAVAGQARAGAADSGGVVYADNSTSNTDSSGTGASDSCGSSDGGGGDGGSCD
ncbi:hypothetical protein [Pseudoduganella lurida]|nr:hypothetical protein [Pseudoduganella lurida]